MLPCKGNKYCILSSMQCAYAVLCCQQWPVWLYHFFILIMWDGGRIDWIQLAQNTAFVKAVMNIRVP